MTASLGGVSAVYQCGVIILHSSYYPTRRGPLLAAAAAAVDLLRNLILTEAKINRQKGHSLRQNEACAESWKEN